MVSTRSGPYEREPATGVFYLDLGDDERAEIVIADRPPDLPSREEAVRTSGPL